MEEKFCSRCGSDKIRFCNLDLEWDAYDVVCDACLFVEYK